MRKEFFITTGELVDLDKASDILEKDWGKWSEVSQESVMYFEIYKRKDYFRGDCKINPFDIVIDIGACAGVFTSLALDMGASRVISFEPSLNNFLLAKKNNPMAEIYNMAVSDKTGETELFHTNAIGGPSIVQEIVDERPDHYISNNTIVKTITLDDIIENLFLDKIDFIKIDAEGAEHNILKGISDENLKKIVNISIEYHHIAFKKDEVLYNSLQQRFLNNGFNTYTHSLDGNYRMLYISRGFA